MAITPETSVLLEQYKSYVADVGNIGTRYATANGFYLSVIAALLAILTFAKDGNGLNNTNNFLLIAIPVFAILLCYIWRRTIQYYGQLFSAKFTVLREMEAGLVFKTYANELTHLRSARLLPNESWVPVILAIPYLLVLAYGVYRAITPH